MISATPPLGGRAHDQAHAGASRAGMTAAPEEVPAEEGLGSADLLAALRAVARRLRQAGGTFHLSDHTFDLPVVLALGLLVEESGSLVDVLGGLVRVAARIPRAPLDCGDQRDQVLDLRHLSIGGTGTGERPVACERGVGVRAGRPLAPERRAAPPTIPGLSSPIRATTSWWRSPCRST